MNFYINILFLFFTAGTIAQTVMDSVITGTVSYKSSQNVYVKFSNTEGINPGDTLFIKSGSNLVPVILVEHRSSTSCAGRTINGNDLKVNDEILAKVKIIKNETKESVYVPVAVAPMTEFSTETPMKRPVKIDPNQPSVNGRISVQSYSNFTNQSKTLNYQRWRYAFQLKANNIGGSKLSYSQYINFAYRASDWGTISTNLDKAIRVYDLSLNYKFGNASTIFAGRYLNPKISNISAVDGIQFEQGFSDWYIGLVAGARPDFNNMGVNFKLFEYGAYINRNDNFSAGSMSNTLSYFEQTNDFKTDRRFVYFQHSNSLIPITRLFVSSEVDLYKKEMGESKGDFSLTSLFASVNVRPGDMISFMLSYDARKNVIYYETFKNIADSIYENETRQGFRTRITLRTVKNLYVGGNYGYRYRPGDLKPSNNYGGYITYSLIPFVEFSPTVSYTYLSTSYLTGTVIGAQISKPIANGLDLTLDYRNTRYEFNYSAADLRQQSASVNLFISLLRPVSLNLSYEGIFEKERTSGRVLANVTYRF